MTGANASRAAEQPTPAEQRQPARALMQGPANMGHVLCASVVLWSMETGGQPPSATRRALCLAVLTVKVCRSHDCCVLKAAQRNGVPEQPCMRAFLVNKASASSYALSVRGQFL